MPQAHAQIVAGALAACLLSAGCTEEHASPASAQPAPSTGAGAGAGAGGVPANAGASASAGSSGGTAAVAGSTAGSTPPATPSDPPPGTPPTTDAGVTRPLEPDAGMTAGAPAIGAEWPTGKPEDYGLTGAVLEAAADSIQRSTGNRYGMVVIRKGVLIYEKYWDGTAEDRHVIYSCTKSWGSTLIGIAVTKGLLSVDDEVRKWVPEPVSGVSSGALVEHLLTQSSHTTPPGQSFRYNSGYLLNTLPEVLEAASGMPSHDFYQRFLVEPLGLSMTWPPCPAGGCPGTRYPAGYIQFGNQPPEAPNAELPLSSVRDQAKLGWLWANNGVWNGQTLIDPAYIAAASKPGAGFRADYGYLWWLENDEQFGAIGGVGNCYVNIMPSRQLVIAVMGNDAGLGQGGGWASFRSVVDAIQD
jgi:CubicO group peptidase (beta-lactamase class C family)